MLRVVVLRVLFFVDMRRLVFSVADLYCLKLFFNVVDADQLIRYLGVIIDYLTWFDGSTHVVICR